VLSGYICQEKLHQFHQLPSVAMGLTAQEVFL